ncbi:MAG TPA: Rad52/Rad22 family DNA repair protein, partial [Streptosporangiaceae bacterium]|nr:Rad52/Rad22 family DNA repair protein [Streptosporangiaceae bacterium]
GYDIRAELTRIFGFGRWSSELLDQEVICETEVKTKTYTDKRTGEEKGGKPAWYVVYRSRVRLTVFAPDGTLVTFHDGSHVGESTHPVRGEAHGNALTNSETYALRRAAINLGDQFGLSLYNKGSLDAIVRWTLVRPEAGAEVTATDTDDVPQVSAEDSASPQAEDESAADAFESAAPVAVPAQESGEVPADPWERPWIDLATEQAASFKTEADGTKLWREAAARGHKREISGEEAERVQALIGARVDDLRKEAMTLALGLLSENDEWRLKVEELSDEEGARAALTELGHLVTAKKMDMTRANRVSRAIAARYPKAAAEGRAAA